MTFAFASVSTYLVNNVLNVKALVGFFNQEKALVGAFTVIVQLRRLIVCSSNRERGAGGHRSMLTIRWK